MDVDKPAEKKDKQEKAVPKDEKKKDAKPEKSPKQLALDDLRQSILLLEKGVAVKDYSFVSRATRRLIAVRRKVGVEAFLPVVDETLLPTNAVSQWIHNHLQNVKDPEPTPEEIEAEKKAAAAVAAAAAAAATPVQKKQQEKPDKSEKEKSDAKPAGDTAPSPSHAASASSATPAPAAAPVVAPPPPPPPPRQNPSAELEMYFQLYTVVLLIDRKKTQEAFNACSELVEKITSINRRTLDLIAARIYYYYSLTAELLDKLADIRNTLLTAHRTACLHHDEPSQAALTNAILRNYLHYNLYAQADKFRLHTKLPDSRSTTEHARYLYYLGKINSIQLHYSEAHSDLQQSIRKAPQKGAVGFRNSVHKLMCIVQLLMGEIPERSVFRQPSLRRSLRPYFQLTQAVRVGDLKLFQQVMDKYREVFLKDKTLTLVDRLRQNVIKTGLRNINLSYSRISIRDICEKLHLPSEEDAEYIIAKAIGDGVIDAVIDRKNHSVFSKENIDIYSTQLPQAAFNARINACLEIHNGAVKSLRFPANANKPKVPTGPSEDDAFED